MTLPSQSVTLTVEQIGELNRKLSTLRHDINNHLSLIMAALELIRAKPDSRERMIATVGEQPSKISQAMVIFSADLEKALGINRS